MDERPDEVVESSGKQDGDSLQFPVPSEPLNQKMSAFQTKMKGFIQKYQNKINEQNRVI